MKIKLTLFLAFFAIIGFTSCEDNPLEGTFVDETGIAGANSGTGGGTGVSTGDYWPRAINNEWNYNVNTGGTETWNMSNTSQVSGLTYYAMSQNNGVFSIAKQAASYYSKIDSNVSIPGYSVSATPIIVKFLQDDAPAGTTWENQATVTYVYTPTAGGAAIPDVTLNLNYKYTMEAVGISRTVNGQVHNDVLHVSSILEIPGSPNVVGDVYYAKNVGVIENTTGTRELKLANYSLN